jgi:hypothetical protein
MLLDSKSPDYQAEEEEQTANVNLTPLVLLQQVRERLLE